MYVRVKLVVIIFKNKASNLISVFYTRSKLTTRRRISNVVIKLGKKKKKKK